MGIGCYRKPLVYRMSETSFSMKWLDSCPFGLVGLQGFEPWTARL